MSDTKRRRLADQLIADIRAGRYRPGDKLPSVRALVASDWGESTVLAAMRLLVAEGWAKATVGAGTFVSDPLPDGSAARDLVEMIADHERRIAALERERRGES